MMKSYQVKNPECCGEGKAAPKYRVTCCQSGSFTNLTVRQQDKEVPFTPSLPLQAKCHQPTYCNIDATLAWLPLAKVTSRKKT